MILVMEFKVAKNKGKDDRKDSHKNPTFGIRISVAGWERD
jgi:hypothetical protein